jgi:hypothetical protein
VGQRQRTVCSSCGTEAAQAPGMERHVHGHLTRPAYPWTSSSPPCNLPPLLPSTGSISENILESIKHLTPLSASILITCLSLSASSVYVADVNWASSRLILSLKSTMSDMVDCKRRETDIFFQMTHASTFVVAWARCALKLPWVMTMVARSATKSLIKFGAKSVDYNFEGYQIYDSWRPESQPVHEA